VTVEADLLRTFFAGTPLVLVAVHTPGTVASPVISLTDHAVAGGVAEYHDAVDDDGDEHEGTRNGAGGVRFLHMNCVRSKTPQPRSARIAEHVVRNPIVPHETPRAHGVNRLPSVAGRVPWTTIAPVMFPITRLS